MGCKMKNHAFYISVFIVLFFFHSYLTQEGVPGPAMFVRA